LQHHTLRTQRARIGLTTALLFLSLQIFYNAIVFAESNQTIGNKKNTRGAGPAVITIDLGKDGRRLGKKRAKVGLVEFYDFECSYCSQFHTQVLPELKKKYIDTGKLLYVVKDFPLKNHPNAYQAAVAANCADKQHKYWPMQGRLLVHQNQISAKFMLDTAKNLKLDMEKFKACVVTPDYQRDVSREIALGRSLGVTSTPTFFIGTIKKNLLTVTGVAKGIPDMAELNKQISDLIAGNAPAKD